MNPREMRSQSPQRKRSPWLGRLLSVLAAGAIVAAILWKYRLDEIVAQLRAGNATAMAPFALLVPATFIFSQCTWDWFVLRATLASPPRYVELLRGRAATAVMLIIGYVVGHGGFGVWLAKKTGTPAAIVSGAVVYTMTSDLAAVSIVASTAVFFGRADVPRGVGIAANVCALVPIALVLLVPREAPGAKTARLRFFAPWRRVPRAIGLLQICGRACGVSWVVLMTWLGARSFGMEIPIAAFATYCPIILLVQSLPLNVGGFGAAQAAWLLLTPWAKGEQILAFQFVFGLFMSAAMFVRGAPFVPSVSREIAAAPSPTRATLEA